jgi:CubicO group peptidase (beta-lactamase class C family)
MSLAVVPADLVDLETALIRDMPSQDREPGHLAAYNNYRAGLAGYLVAETSGMSTEKGQRVLSHLGDHNSSSTGPWLLPEHDLGIYVAYNSDRDDEARTELWDAFLDHTFSAEITVTPARAAVGSADLERFEGTYGISRISSTTPVQAVPAPRVDDRVRGGRRPRHQRRRRWPWCDVAAVDPNPRRAPWLGGGWPPPAVSTCCSSSSSWPRCSTSSPSSSAHHRCWSPH